MRFQKLLFVMRFAVLAVVLAASAASAQNLVENPGFDTDIAGWGVSHLVPPYAAWSPEGETSLHPSGALQFDLAPGSISRSVSSACFVVAPGERFVFGASVSSPETGVASTYARANLYFFGGADCTGESYIGIDSPLGAHAGTAGWGPAQGTAVAPPWAHSAILLLGVASALPDHAEHVRFDNAFVYSGASCAETATVSCLQQGRFRVTAEYLLQNLERGHARTVSLTEDSGYLWFFAKSNIEVVLKVLDGCGFNDRFWVFAAGLTNLGVELTITDTLTGESWEFDNPVNDAFPPRQDIEAFATCP